jgi:predicted transcriptional regulator
MPEHGPLQGELQLEVMAVLWRLGSGTVEQVRQSLPEHQQGAYTTVQTVLNRLADRGLLLRERVGPRIVYRPSLTEGEYLSRSIAATLQGATPDARQAALAKLVDGLDSQELAELERLAQAASRARRREGP